MSISSYFNKTGLLYKRTLGATNEYGEKSWTETSSSISCALQPLARIEDGYVVINSGKSIRSTHTIYCAITVDIEEGDKVVIDGQTFRVLLVSDDAGRGNHLKVRVEELV